MSDKTCNYASYHGYCDLKQKWTVLDAPACGAWEPNPLYRTCRMLTGAGVFPKCSECGAMMGLSANYCQTCGAKVVQE